MERVPDGERHIVIVLALLAQRLTEVPRAYVERINHGHRCRYPPTGGRSYSPALAAGAGAAGHPEPVLHVVVTGDPETILGL